MASVATLSRSDAMLTITPGSAGQTIITVTATDVGGSNTSVSQRFTSNESATTTTLTSTD